MLPMWQAGPIEVSSSAGCLAVCLSGCLVVWLSGFLGIWSALCRVLKWGHLLWVRCAHLNANLNEILIRFKDCVLYAEPFDVTNAAHLAQLPASARPGYPIIDNVRTAACPNNLTPICILPNWLQWAGLNAPTRPHVSCQMEQRFSCVLWWQRRYICKAVCSLQLTIQSRK